MIAKHVPMKSAKKSDFSSLASYIADEQGKDERVVYTSVTNCHSDDLKSAIIEVRNIQDMNRRAESDKTYHLIVSFRADERPSDDVLKKIEGEICDGLGFGEHQRVSAIHHDTDNLHIHIAINKIHPTKFTIHNPYYDHKVLGHLCEKLEAKYGLEADNHVAKNIGSENRAKDMEHHAGVESLLGWIKRECLPELRSVSSWDEMHVILATNGLFIAERGNGLVISTTDGIAVKASSVARDLSKNKLESRLGAFTPAPDSTNINKAKSYSQRPLRTRIDTTLLFSEYQNEKRLRTDNRAHALKLLRQKRDRQYATVKATGKLKRASIKLAGGNRHEKRLSHSFVTRTVKKELDDIREQYNRDRTKILAENQTLQWADWLRKKAAHGDSDALAALRARNQSSRLRRNTIEGKGTRNAADVLPPNQDNVTKSGTIIYNAGDVAVRDDGKKLAISRGASTNGLVTALQLAMSRYGNRITVNGTDEFKAQIVEAAVASGLNITFSNSALEQKRTSLLSTFNKESTDESQSKRRPSTRGRSSIAGSTSAARSRTTGAEHPGDGNSRGGTTGATKPNVGRIGRKPPPAARTRLRNLSGVPMVRIASGSEVLLPRNVSNNMEQQGAAANNSLRRAISRYGIGLDAIDAATKYVTERNEKKSLILDISKHRLYNEDVGIALYAGIRRVDGHAMALLKRDSNIVVMPITDAVASRLKRLSIGDEVTITKECVIKKRSGRRR